MAGYKPRPGDRFRAEIICRGGSYGSDTGDRYEIQMDTAELIEPEKTPGQRAFEAWAGTERIGGPLPWKHVAAPDRALWESIAEAARRG